MADKDIYQTRDIYQADELPKLDRPATAVSLQDPDEKPIIGWTPYIILCLCALAQFQNTFIGIAPAANVFSIVGAIGGVDKRIWVVQAQAIPSIVSGPIMAIFADMYGRRWVIIVVWAIAALASIVAMTAHSINVIILAQTIAGIGCGISGIMFAVPSEVLPNRYRTNVQTFLSWFSGLASIPALIAMGAATKADPVNGWRWVFRTLFMINSLLFLGFLFFYHPPKRGQSQAVSIWKRFATLDWIGYGLLMIGLVPLLMGFAWASDPAYGWKNPHAYAAVAAGAVGFVLCLVYEWKGRSDGFLHHQLFKDGRNFPIALVCISVEGSLFYLMNNIWPTQVFTLYENDPIIASLYLLPFFLTIVVVSPFISIYATKRKDIKWPILVGFVFFLAAVIGFGNTTATSNKLGIAMDSLAGLGFSSPLIMIVSLTQYSTPPWLIATASSLLISARTLGGTVGYAIALVIYNNETSKHIPDVAAAAISAGLPPSSVGQLIGDLLSNNFAGLGAIPGINGRVIGAAIGTLHDAQSRALRITWLAFIPGVVIAAVCVVLVRNPTERMNWLIDAPLAAVHHHHEAAQPDVLAEQKAESKEIEGSI